MLACLCAFLLACVLACSSAAFRFCRDPRLKKHCKTSNSIFVFLKTVHKEGGKRKVTKVKTKRTKVAVFVCGNEDVTVSRRNQKVAPILIVVARILIAKTHLFSCGFSDGIGTRRDYFFVVRYDFSDLFLLSFANDYYY